MHPIRTDAQRKKDILGGISDEQIICLSLGRHRFASDELKPGATRIPRGMSVTPIRDGGFQVVDTCLRGCGKTRTKTSYTGMLADLSHTTYAQSDRWTVVSRDDRDELGIAASDFTGERLGRNEQLIKGQLKVKSARPSPAPAARFSGGSGA